MADALTPLELGTDLNQALRFHSRERRRSLAGVPELFRTHHIFNETRTLSVTDATNATPIVVTTAAHGFVTGMTVTITEVEGNTAANGTWSVTVLTATTFELDTSVGNGAYTTGGIVVNDAAMPVPLVDAGSFPDRETLVTFWTAIRITGATPTGLLFEIGDATTAVAAWIDDSEISFRAGDATAADRGLATFDNTVSLPDTLELDLVFAVRPGDGRVRIWGNGREIARDTATNGQLTNGWAASSDGAFAAAAVGALPADVTQTGAPTNYDVIEPLSTYTAQVPRHFV